jgi:hypothetical protein
MMKRTGGTAMPSIGGAAKFKAMLQAKADGKAEGAKKGKKPMPPPKAKSKGGKVAKKDAGALSAFGY